ncbi:MAG: LPS assembly lipoprotein LptE [Gemmatimonadetes bacterium]|nr:LPS assembly lipoprotein LptE [Gemmatimonadota bacterium]
MYGFAGGGLPAHIRTVAVLPFDNQTGEVALTQEVAVAVRLAMESRLGLRVASEEQADAVVRGSITRYEADQPLSFRQQNQGTTVSVTRRLVTISISVEIYDQVEDRVLWQRGGMRVEGEYEPPGEDEKKGRDLALETLVADLVDGAQSQW